MRYVFVKDLANYKKGQTVSDNLKDNTVAYIDGLTMAILLEVGVIREDRPSMVEILRKDKVLEKFMQEPDFAEQVPPVFHEAFPGKESKPWETSDGYPYFCVDEFGMVQEVVAGGHEDLFLGRYRTHQAAEQARDKIANFVRGLRK